MLKGFNFLFIEDGLSGCGHYPEGFCSLCELLASNPIQVTVTTVMKILFFINSVSITLLNRNLINFQYEFVLMCSDSKLTSLTG